METLYEKSFKKIESTSLDFVRGMMEHIHWDARLIVIKGARGVGKTTLMLQRIKKFLPINHTVLYVSLDNIWFAQNSLSQIADDFVKSGGKFLFLDEVHKYPDWSVELKNMYDDHPELHIVFTGSSMLEILNGRADLSRRAVTYHMQGLSFREFLHLVKGIKFPVLKLEELLENHLPIARQIASQIKPLEYFQEYVKTGYFPFFQEVPVLYHLRLEEVINMTLEIELPLLRKVGVAYVPRLKQLLQIISESVPFIPNVSKLSEKIGLNRNTFITYLYFLQEAHLTRNLFKDNKGVTQLQKPNKIYLENTNFQFALSPKNTNVGNLRETFFLNQVGYLHALEYVDQGDFRIDEKFIVEVGGEAKTRKQIQDLPHSYIAADKIEFGVRTKIPLWLFGFLY